MQNNVWNSNFVLLWWRAFTCLSNNKKNIRNLIWKKWPVMISVHTKRCMLLLSDTCTMYNNLHVVGSRYIISNCGWLHHVVITLMYDRPSPYHPHLHLPCYAWWGHGATLMGGMNSVTTTTMTTTGHDSSPTRPNITTTICPKKNYNRTFRIDNFQSSEWIKV